MQAIGPMPTPVAEGYDFLGWFTDPYGGVQVLETELFQAKSHITLYAHWAVAEKYWVSFDPCGGALKDGEWGRFAYYMHAIGSMPTPVAAGYAFLGWFTEPYSGVQVLETELFQAKSHITLYAHWALAMGCESLGLYDCPESSTKVAEGNETTVFTGTLSDGSFYELRVVNRGSRFIGSVTLTYLDGSCEILDGEVYFAGGVVYLVSEDDECAVAFPGISRVEVSCR